MYHYFPTLLTPRILAGFTSTKRHVMDELAWRASETAGRFAQQSTDSLVIIGSGDPLDPPEPHILPTPTDVPAPAPTDVPTPEPMDVPPPTPTDVPPPKPQMMR
jgi:hypothetical protein